MREAFRSGLIITILTFATQIVLFVGNLITAALFGATSNMDAYLAAITLPQYIITVLLGSLGYVFIPVFIDYKAHGGEERAFQLAIGLFNNAILFLGILSILGIIFSRQLILLTAPGLSQESLNTAVKVAIITWPTILATGAFSLLASIYQAEKKFTWLTIVPFIGAILYILLLILLGDWLGVVGLAIATSVGVIVKAILLKRAIFNRTKYKLTFNWKDNGTIQIFKLLMPLVFVAFVTKFTPILDRYLASNLQEGSISHINYAFKLTTLLSVLISTGVATVIFPKMALDVSTGSMNALRSTLSKGLRLMWLIVAPIICLGIPLSIPAVLIVFQRGEFTLSDSIAVAGIFKIYLIALIAMSLSNVTSKGFYVLKDTKTLAIYGTIEAVLYAVYTILLTNWIGINGIAIGFVIYFSISLMWQLLILNYRTEGNKYPSKIIMSFSKTAIAAGLGGIVAYFLTITITLPIFQLLGGVIFGLTAYILILKILKSEELDMTLKLIPGISKRLISE